MKKEKYKLGNKNHSWGEKLKAKKQRNRETTSRRGNRLRSVRRKPKE